MANFPTSVSTNANLYIAVNGVQTTLAASILATDTTIQLTSTTGFPTTGYVTIDNSEVVAYTGISGPNLTGCSRGADGTTAAPHSLGVTVGATIVAAHHNLLKDEVIAIETFLGVGGANVQPAGNYITALTSDVSASGPGSAAATVNSVGGSSAANVHSAELAANAATSSPTASTIVKRDSNGNTKVNTVVENFSTTVTAAGTTPLTAASSPVQQFTGTTTQTVTLPDCTTLSVGYQITILNRSTGAVAVNNNGGSLQQSIPGGAQFVFTCTNIGSANGIWDVSSAAGTGTVTSVSGTTNQITSTGGNTPVLAIANPLTLPGGMTAGGNIAMATHKVTGLGNGTAAQDAAAFGQIKIIQVVTATSSTASASTSTSYQSSNLTASITPTSASNKIMIIASGSCGQAGNADRTVISLFRGSTDLATSATGMAEVQSGSGATNSPLCLTWLDSPATTSSTTYTIKYKSTNGNTASILTNSETGIIWLIEVVA